MHTPLCFYFSNVFTLHLNTNAQSLHSLDFHFEFQSQESRCHQCTSGPDQASHTCNNSTYRHHRHHYHCWRDVMSFTPPSGLLSCLKRPRWPVLKKTTLSDLRFPAKVYPRFRACSFRHGLSVLPTPPEDSEHLKLHFQLLCHRRGDSVTASHYEQYDKVVIFSGEAPDTRCGGLRLEIQILLDSVIKSRYPMWLCFLYLLQSWPIWSCLREWHTVLCNKSKVSSHQLRGHTHDWWKQFLCHLWTILSIADWTNTDILRHLATLPGRPILMHHPWADTLISGCWLVCFYWGILEVGHV